jgi:hypothetical protein
MPLCFYAARTSLLLPPKSDIYVLFDMENFPLKKGDILCIATKCLVIHQGRCIKIGTIAKEKLIRD